MYATDEEQPLISFSVSQPSASTPLRNYPSSSGGLQVPSRPNPKLSPIRRGTGLPASSLRSSVDGGLFSFSPGPTAAPPQLDEGQSGASFLTNSSGSFTELDSFTTSDPKRQDSELVPPSPTKPTTTETHHHEHPTSIELSDDIEQNTPPTDSLEQGRISMWLSPNESGEPDDFSKWDHRRARITALAGMGTFLIPFASSMLLPAQGVIQRMFGWHPIAASVALQIFSVLAGIMPVIISPWGDRLGRKPILLASLACFCLFQAATGFAPSLPLLITGRALSGGAISSVYAVGTGCIYDVFRPRDRALGLGLLVAPAALGSLLGPVVGGYVTTSLGWRFTIWLPVLFALPVLLLYIFFLPETLNSPSSASSSSSSPQPKQQLPSPNPLLAIREFLLHPRIFWIATSRALATAEVFSYFVLSQSVLIAHQFSPDMLGLSSVPYGIGSVLGGLFGGKVGDLLAQAFGPAMRLGLAIITDGSNTALFMIWAVVISAGFEWLAISMAFLMGLFNGTARSASYAAMIATEPRRAATITGIAQLWTFVFVGLGSYLAPLLSHSDGSIIPVFVIFTYVVALSLLPEVYLCLKELQMPALSLATTINIDPSEPETAALLGDHHRGSTSLTTTLPAEINVVGVPRWQHRGGSSSVAYSFVGRQASISDLLAFSESPGTTFQSFG